MTGALDVPPAIPRDRDGPVFREPWEAQAFALAVRLHERGLFAWPEFAAALAREVGHAGARDDGSGYYRHWLAALEALLASKGCVAEGELAARADAVAHAAAHDHARR